MYVPHQPATPSCNCCSLTNCAFQKPEDLPEKSHEFTPPVPDSAKKDHLDISTPKTGSKPPTTPDGDEADSIIQPFHSFILSFTMILVSEVGDKTFLVAALMAMKHDRMVVFSAAFGALLVMTVLSAVLGHAVPVLIPKRITSFLASALFFVFGARLLREGMAMDPNEGVTAEMHEVEQELAEKEKELGRNQGNGVSPYALEMGLEGGRHSRSKSRISTPPRSPSESPQRGHGGRNALTGMIQGASNLCSLLLSPAWVQTFIMTFLGEWGDRSQIATIAMAAGQDYWWVTLGATCGHAICTGVAVIGGRAIAGRVSLKVGMLHCLYPIRLSISTTNMTTVTIGGAIAFLVFGFIYLFESFYA
jgi:putative Ca2+/H+ antiporter (TMEM165/GDT1 family)